MLDLKAIHKAQRETAASYTRASKKIHELGLPEDLVATIDAELDKALTAKLSDLSLENISKIAEQSGEAKAEKAAKKKDKKAAEPAV
jgi:uncharacterized protein YdeI (YjbR/CyaY-like superfamily)